VYRGLARVGAGQPEGLDEARAAIDEMRAADFFELHVHVANMASSALILGDLAQFRALNTDAIAQLQGSQRPRISIMYADLAVAAYVSGDWASALELAADCRSGLEAGRYSAEAACEWQGVEARIAARRGEPEQAAIRQAEALASARLEFSPQSLVPELAGSAWLGMLRGDTTLAEELLAEMLSLTGDRNVLLSLLPYLSPELIETAEALGRAEGLRGQLEAVVLDTPWRAAMLGILRGDPAAAADIYAGIGAQAYAAFAHLRAAETLAESGAAAAARHLEQATAFYERVGATLYLDRARTLEISRG
jgi:hypothetical protein